MSNYYVCWLVKGQGSLGREIIQISLECSSDTVWLWMKCPTPANSKTPYSVPERSTSNQLFGLATMLSKIDLPLGSSASLLRRVIFGGAILRGEPNLALSYCVISNITSSLFDLDCKLSHYHIWKINHSLVVVACFSLNWHNFVAVYDQYKTYAGIGHAFCRRYTGRSCLDTYALSHVHRISWNRLQKCCEDWIKPKFRHKDISREILIWRVLQI